MPSESFISKAPLPFVACVIEEKANNSSAHVSCALFPEHIAAMETGLRSVKVVFRTPNLQPDFSLESYLYDHYY